MHFLGVLKNRTDSSYVAKIFIENLIESSASKDELCLDIAANFVEDCLASIGIECEFNASDIETELANYTWPAQRIQKYIFAANPLHFRAVETFLSAFGEEVQKHYMEYVKAVSVDATENSTPIDWFMELLAVWCKVHRLLLEFEKEHTVGQSYLEEPLSRISFHLLVSVNCLRKLHDEYSDCLGLLCNRLLENATAGLFFPATHRMIADGVITMLEEDLLNFYCTSPRAISVYQSLLKVKNQPETYMATYKSLTTLLSRQVNGGEIAFLIEFLMSDNMQQIFYTTLKKCKQQRPLLQVLLFLKALHSALPGSVRLSNAIVESIFALAIGKYTQMTDTACELYIFIMNDTASDSIILNHIVKLYFRMTSSLQHLNSFVRCVQMYLPIMRDLNVFLTKLSLRQSRHPNESSSPIMIAWFLRAAFIGTRQDMANEEQIGFLLNLIRALQQGLARKEFTSVVGVVMDIFIMVDFDELSVTNRSEVATLMLEVDSFAREMFLSSLDFPFLGFMPIWSKLRHNMQQFSLPAALDFILNDLEDLEQCLEAQETVRIEVLRHYRNVLTKLEATLKFESVSPEILMRIVEALNRRVVETRSIFSMEKSRGENLFLDCYAVNVLLYAIVSKGVEEEQLTDDNKRVIKRVAHGLHGLLVEKLLDITKSQKAPMFRIKTFVCSFIELHVFFGLQTELSRSIYDLLMHLISNNAFSKHFKNPHTNDPNKDTICHRKRIVDYKAQLLHDCYVLHECQRINIQGHSVYEICLYYALDHPFNDLLKRLLLTLSSKHLEIYKRVVPLVLFHLNRMKPSISEKAIKHCIKAHRDLLNETSIENKELFRIHVIMGIIQMVAQFLRTHASKKSADRLIAFKYLPIWLGDLDLSTDQSNVVVVRTLNALRLANFLLPHEIITYNAFLKRFEPNDDQRTTSD